MTTWYAQAAGNLSTIAYNDQADGLGTPGTWDGMATTDTVNSNGNTVTVDVFGWTRALLVSTGGDFLYFDAGNNTITCNVSADTTRCFWALQGSGTITINGDILGGAAAGAFGILLDAAGIVQVNGDVSGGSNSTAYGFYNKSTGTGIVVGDISGGSGSSAYGVFHSSSGTFTSTGDVSGGTGGNASGVVTLLSGAATLYLGTLFFDPLLEAPVSGKNIYYTFGEISYYSEVGGDEQVLSEANNNEQYENNINTQYGKNNKQYGPE